MRNFFHACYEGGKAAISSIWAHGMRSALTTLGIIIGVAAVIAVVAVMEGLSSTITSQLDDLGSDMVTLSAYTSPEQEMLGFVNRLNYEDFLMLKNKVKGVQDMTATMRSFSLGAKVQFGRNSTESQIIGTDYTYKNVVRVHPELGRFISESDDLRRRRVAFIGSSLIKKLNMPDNPVGEFISLGGEWFRVVGVAETRGSLFGFDQDNYIIAPFSAIQSLNGERVSRNIDIMFRPKTDANLDEIKIQMARLLRKKYKVAAGEADPFQFISAEKTKQSFNQITTTVTLVASGVVGISLLVGGIGIMNIMLVSVTERTREIGIVKALGATPEFILIQFLLEALTLSLFGGLLGLALGYGIATLIAMLMFSSAVTLVPLWAVGLAIGFTTLIGVIFGLAPALKASKLHPIDALRYE